MRYTDVGAGVRVSEIGYGCGSIWGMRSFSRRQAAELLNLAVELGITYFDTGPTYSGGNAEVRLGQLGRELGAEVALGTKVGSHRGNRGRLYKDFRPKALRASLHRSLQNLARSQVDLLTVHDPPEDAMNDELVETMTGFRAEGLARAIGVSCGGATARRVVQTGAFDHVMMTLNVAKVDNIGIALSAAERRMAVIAKSPLAHNIVDRHLYRPDRLSKAWYVARLLRNYRPALAKRSDFDFLNDLEGMSAQQAALRFVLETPGVASAVVGTLRPEHLMADVAATALPQLPPDVRSRIESVHRA